MSNPGPGRLPRSAESWLSLALSKLQKAAHGFLSGATALADSGVANVMFCVCFLQAQSRPSKFYGQLAQTTQPHSHHHVTVTVSNEMKSAVHLLVHT